jgi:hypothetical protein
MSATDPKMAQFPGRLTHWEQQIICHQVKTHSGEQRYAHLHPGLLPFVPMVLVRQMLVYAKTTRAVACIIAKLPPTEYWDLPEMIILRHKKVLRMFGPHPERGRAINWLPKRVAGRILVSQVVTLTKKDRGAGLCRYEVGVAPEYKSAVLQWLSDICR